VAAEVQDAMADADDDSSLGEDHTNRAGVGV
jgi:hypothetical protein